MQLEDQLCWAELPESLRASIDLDAATEILRILTSDEAGCEDFVSAKPLFFS